jgi:ATP-binding cassette subfamily F protein uup
MDNVCNNILEIENGKLFSYKGDFAYYIQKKSEREIADASEQEKNKNIYRRELEWIRKQPKARTTKSKSRVDAFDDVEAKALARKDNLQMELNMKMNRLGGKVIEMKKVYKQFGDKPILKGFDYTFKRKERIGIVGPNGTGKTTFLNIVAGLEKEDSGKVNIGETVVFGYFNQQGLQFKEDMRTIEYVKDIAENFVLADGTKVSASQFMLLFLFDADKQYTYLSKLSGGEKRRLQLMAILYRNPNFLILDEPTNDLDLITLQVLENFLLHFEGCVLIVSHDRYFMDKLVDHLFVFEGEAIINDYPGNFTEYRAYQKAVSRNKNKDKEPELISLSDLTPAVKEKVKMNYNDKKEYEKLEREMAKLEEEKIKLSEALIGQTDFESIQKISDHLTTVVKSLEEKGNRWLEIAMQYE